ncbi:MAG: Vms1/Ankzf1 family peptidyl-tRNA hydrolase [Acidimicrobiia bacterium]
MSYRDYARQENRRLSTGSPGRSGRTGFSAAAAHDIMLTLDELKRIASLSSPEGIVSLYLTIDPVRGATRGQLLRNFKSALKRFDRRSDSDSWRAAAERERKRIEAYLKKSTTRGLALFSCEPEDIWEVVELQTPVSNFLDVGSTTRTALLAQILDQYPRLVVAVVQRDRALIYVTEQRRSGKRAELETDVPGQHRAGGWSQSRFERHIEVHFGNHLKELVYRLEGLHKQYPFNRLAFGGADEVTSELIRHLPGQLSQSVIGTFPVDFKHESEEEIIERARRLREEDKRKKELKLVNQVIDGSESESAKSAVSGLDDTLEALNLRAVRALVLVDGLLVEGAECPTCGYLATASSEPCPGCGGLMESSSNIVDRAVEHACLSDAKVDVVFGVARERLLAKDGIGGLLRF